MPELAVLRLSLPRFFSKLSGCFSRNSSRWAVQVLDFCCRPIPDIISPYTEFLA